MLTYKTPITQQYVDAVVNLITPTYRARKC
jgi:hypothetical protein